MSQNLKAMSRKQRLFRLYDGYSALLKNAQQHRAFITAHANSLTPEKYQLLLKNADADIAFARAKLDSMIPAIPNRLGAKPVQVTPLHSCPQGQELQGLSDQVASTPQESQTPVPSEVQSGATPETEHSGSVGWVIAGIIGFSVATPLFISWINKDPQRNLARVRDFLNAFKNA